MRALFVFVLSITLCVVLLAQGAANQSAPKKPEPNLKADWVEWKPSVAPPSTEISSPRRIYTTATNINAPLPQLVVPQGSTNLALHKPVIASDTNPVVGNVAMITDGVITDKEGSWVEVAPGPQWVQIDLQKMCSIYGVHIWHFYTYTRVYRDVIVQVADDEAFATNVRTLYNNDYDNSSKLGVGSDKEFYESNRGFLIDTHGPEFQGVVARYVRLYSQGNSYDNTNHYIEVEVIGKPAGAVPKIPPGFQLPTLPALKLPASVTNLALNRAVWSDTGVPIDGTLEQITNGLKEGWVTLDKGKHWVEIDLAAPCHIYGIHIWRNYNAPYVYKDVRVEVSSDRQFRKDIHTVFNNSPKAPHKPYLETSSGFLIDTTALIKKGITPRYVRVWSNGNQWDEFNRYTEIEVMGTTDWEPSHFELPPPTYQGRLKPNAPGNFVLPSDTYS